MRDNEAFWQLMAFQFHVRDNLLGCVEAKTRHGFNY